MIWGKDDCLTDILGADAHQKIGWVTQFKSHNDALYFAAALPPEDRWKLFKQTTMAQGWSSVDNPQPGDVGIGGFVPAVGSDFAVMDPWFAVMQVDHLWYVRMPRMNRVVIAGYIEVYRCPPQP